MSVAVRRLDDFTQARRWDEFVLVCEEGTFFHLSGWKEVIERSYRHRCFFIFAEENGEIQGVLPLVHINSTFFGNALVSNAFCVVGGPAAVNASARHALDVEAVRLAEELGVDYLEYRMAAPMHDDWACNSELYVNFAKVLDPDPEKTMLAIPRKQRAVVRKGLKGGLVAEIDDRVDRFFRLYAESVRNHGTPVHSKQYFANLKTVFADNCEIVTVLEGSSPVSTVMNFYFKDQVLAYYGGGSPRARVVAAFDFMYWDTMRRGCENGLRTFDYGRSKRNTGSFDFKKNWGYQPQPLYYEYKLIRCKDMPNVNPLNPSYRLFISAWRRLPLTVANTFGPYLARQLG